MTKAAVRRFLVVYFAILWSAVVLRIDHYPLTWAPMYSRESKSDRNSSRIVDKERMRQGFFVTRRDGSTGFVSHPDLNINRWQFWRLYYQRAFGSSPNKFDLGNANIDAFNRFIRGLEVDEPLFVADWEWRVLRSVNQTLGLEPEDPEFIVRIEAEYERRTYLRSDPSQTETKTKRARLEWSEEFAERWRDEFGNPRS